MKYLKLILTFYTYRAMMLHVGFLLGLYETTFVIACFVAGGSFFFNVIWPGYTRQISWSYSNRISEIMRHYSPFFFLPRIISEDGIFLLVISLTIYILYHGPRKVFDYYNNIFATISKIMA